MTKLFLGESFGLILQNLKLICIIGTVQTYLRFWGERLNFGITVVEIQPKVWERRRKRWREKMLNFGNGISNFLCPILLPVCVECPKWKEKKKNWQTNCGNIIAKIGKKKICNNCSNGIAENGGKKMWFRNLGRVKKKKVLCLQYLHNKSHVISYY